MSRSEIRVEILGTRGSMPLEGERFSIFGGATSCVRVVAREQGYSTEEIYLDAGSGIVLAKPLSDSNISVLLSHLHLDHIIGLPFFPALSMRNRKINLFVAPRSSFGGKEALDRIFSPPFWPVSIGDYPADTVVQNISDSFMIGCVRVDTCELEHPGGSTCCKLTCGDKVIVYACDFEHSDAGERLLAGFAKNADLLIYDGQYTQEEYERCKGFGHSIPEIGIKIGEAANVRKLVFSHHSPEHDDDFILKWEKKLQQENDWVSFARVGETIYFE